MRHNFWIITGLCSIHCLSNLQLFDDTLPIWNIPCCFNILPVGSRDHYNQLLKDTIPSNILNLCKEKKHAGILTQSGVFRVHVWRPKVLYLVLWNVNFEASVSSTSPRKNSIRWSLIVLNSMTLRNECVHGHHAVSERTL